MSNLNMSVPPDQQFEKDGRKIERRCFTVIVYNGEAIAHEWKHIRIGSAQETFRTLKQLMNEGKDIITWSPKW